MSKSKLTNAFSSLMLILLIIVGLSTNMPAQENPNDPPVGYPNWKIKTLGGMQFWTDVRIVGDWKVQHNSTTGHFRLLAPDLVRHAWGNQAHCNQELDKKIVDQTVERNSGKMVVLLHGLVRTNQSMNSMADYVQSNSDFSVVNFQYASSRETVDAHAKNLRSVIDGLGNDVTEINFVGHSLGNLVVRHYLGDSEKQEFKTDSRIGRMVMLGPPNQGSQMAMLFRNSFLFHTFAGASGAQLSNSWEKLAPHLAIPDFEFGIVSGAQEHEDDWSNVVLTGKDDFTVSLQETKLEGAHDTLAGPFLHTTIMNQTTVQESTLRFIEHGYFQSETQRQAIPRDWKPEAVDKVDQPEVQP